ncbi:hypothetical protein HG535_0A06880 [Zygotorulaspora mrakii]|uniref:Spindle pole body-associated protein Vik1/Cik1 microtubule binding domain-containing protein n=1 Tax=Zygotorulaspora mrakii TaxID=42260 RepID=A0A7H9AWS2_ZYGMR|nr:uncharacterized protein HG535_0A06880 [Zygotorulaspora mrakii]QLG70746.1 hypothetical protein HG535_0A06880 [Zygotorulaspora mrakii]
MHNHSRIPSISFNNASGSKGREYPQVKRPRLSSPMLQDLTNQMHTARVSHRNSTDVTQSARLMNKYVFGDAAAIEEVKKRERKILKDILHFKNAISEIEKETSQIRETQLPDLQYSMSKRFTICNEIRKEITKLDSQIQLKDREVDLQRKNEEMAKSNLAKKFSIEVQELENQLKKILDDENAQWNSKILELENLKPDKEIAYEIKQLKEELSKVTEELNTLRLRNEEKYCKYDEELNEKFKNFQGSKKIAMDSLTDEQKQLKDRGKKLELERETLLNEMSELDNITKEVVEKISGIKTSSTEILAQNKPSKEKLDLIERQHKLAKEEFEIVKEIAQQKEIYYNAKFDKMEQEQLRRRRLENSIDELTGKVRRFAYILNDTETSTRYSVDYAGKTLRDISNEKTYTFTRIIPSSLMLENDLLMQEYHMYHEMCLQKGYNFNLISVSEVPSESFRIAVVDYVNSKCHESHQIHLQYVFLSEEMPSQDMLLKTGHELDNEIKLKIEQDSLELDSTRIELMGDLKNLSSIINDRNQTLMSGIGVLKFQLLRKDDLLGRPVNFYFMEINDKKMMKTLDDSVASNQLTSSPIGLIFNKLLSDTKSFFLFHIDQTKENEALLEVSGNLRKLKNFRIKSNDKNRLL